MGHHCWVRGRRRPNGESSGRGHRDHVCKECASAASTSFSDVHDEDARAAAYDELELPGTCYLAYRDSPAILAEHGVRALDSGCGAGRTTRFLRGLGGARRDPWLAACGVRVPCMLRPHRSRGLVRRSAVAALALNVAVRERRGGRARPPSLAPTVLVSLDDPGQRAERVIDLARGLEPALDVVVELDESREFRKMADVPALHATTG